MSRIIPEITHTLFQKTTKTRDMEIQTGFLQHNITIEFLPYQSDMPYRIIVGNNPVNWVDPLGLFLTKFIPTKWIAKQIAKQIAKGIAGKPFDFNPGHPKEVDDDNDGIPNFMDPDSEQCEFNCEPTRPEPPDPIEPSESSNCK